ncbi:hypothetical protein B484DRAFT_393963 [Ochromonadaceae sp. CCMP2298]|nr:hypothetical protein B484DRAFT_393963 [Ochromonadaceae sp. CCMP2298]
MKLPFASDSFSTVVFRSGVEHFTKPTEVFTELWRVTKPGGKCFVCFTSKPQLPAPLAPVKMWQTMSDEQKIWITGSYFHYSTLGGWENIEGYDILGSTGNQSLVFANSTEAGQPTAYVVQSAKMVLPPLEELDGSTTQNLSANMQKRLLGMGNLVPDDRKFVSVRLAAQYNASTSDAQKAQLVDSIDRLNSIYSVLKDVKEIVVPSPVKAMLATMMLSQWEGSAEQLGALRMSLGLDTADDFWGPVGSSTMQMAPKPKIYFLGDLVPKFGAPRYAAALAGFPALLAEVVSISKRKVPEATESQIQAFSVDLLLADYFDSEKGTKERILRYVESLTAEQLESMLII